MIGIEMWKDIDGFVGIYQISNFGRVKSLSRKIKNGRNSFFISKEKFLKFRKNKKGYLQVNLSKDGKDYFKGLHQIVADNFIDKEDSSYEVNHIDGDKTNNCLNNLEWVSHKDNMIHAVKHGLLKYDKEILLRNNELKRKRVSQYDKSMNFIRTYSSINEAIRETGFTAIGKCISGKHKTAGGFIWKKE